MEKGNEVNMKIDVKWLQKERACQSGIDWFKNQNKSDGIEVIEALMVDNHFNWANWTIVRLMTHEQKVEYAIFAADQVIEIYEKKYPNDKRPRNAIEAARAFLKDPSDGNKKAVYAAAHAAYAAYAAAYAAADAATHAAYAAADAATHAAYAADAAYAAVYAAYAADAAVYAARKKLQKKIIENGIKILREKPRWKK